MAARCHLGEPGAVGIVAELRQAVAHPGEQLAGLDPEQLADRRHAHPARGSDTAAARRLRAELGGAVERVSASRVAHRDLRASGLRPPLRLEAARAGIELLEGMDQLA